MGQVCSSGVAPEEEMGTPVLTYLPFAGRGEISRLCAAAGGLKIEEKMMGMKDERAALCKQCGCIGTGLPVLQHGSLNMSQSTAVQHYICAISPLFRAVPMRARGVDAMYFAHVEDILADVGKSGFFGELFGGPPTDKVELAKAVEKWCGHLESQIPQDGAFINQLPYPTGADCVILCFFKATAPWNFLFEKAGVSKDKYPKLKALAEKTAAAPGVKEYLATSTTFGKNPF